MQSFSFEFFPSATLSSSLSSGHDRKHEQQQDNNDDLRYVITSAAGLKEITQPDPHIKNLWDFQVCKTNLFEFSISCGNNRLEGVPEDTDIVPGKYEGGLKVWECSRDLGRYLFDILNTAQSL